jgi:hypothetical protein
VLSDSSPKVVLSALECHDILLKRAPVTMKQHADAVTDNLMAVSLDSKAQVRSELYRLMKEHMLACGPMTVVDTLMEDLDHKNPKVIDVAVA